ncbi:protein IQ-DOMAIN 3-like [Curcuma longa]|uniref:protein IQ-DOMAIN 3-like n=1 Tax=Curcuma longa TaxID=136217 RepID=UPI003D9FA5EE
MMASKLKWFSSLRKSLLPQCLKSDFRKGNNDKSKHAGFHGSQEMESCIQNSTSLLPPISIEEDKLMVTESKQSSHTYTVALATAIATEAAAATVRAAAEVIRLSTSTAKSSSKPTEDVAAVRIQTAFRGHQARASFRASKGLDRLRRVVDGIAAKSQTTKTLYSLQTMSRVQMQLPSRYKLEEIHMPQQPKFEKEDNKKKIGEGWNHSLQSKEQAEAMQLNKKEAALRRERALAYAFSHQWRSSSKSEAPVLSFNRSGKFILQDPSNPQLGWSWLARLMSGKPWENQQNASSKTPSSAGGARRAITTSKSGSDSGSSSGRNMTVQSPTKLLSRASSAGRKGSLSLSGGSRCYPEGEVRPRLRRHSIAGLPSAIDCNRLIQSPGDLKKSCVVSPQTAKPRSRSLQEKGPVGKVKEQPAARIRRLSFCN